MINIRKLEAELWESADLLRAGSKLTSNQYCMPVLGLIFLRYAYSRFKLVEAEILKDRPMRGGRIRPVSESDFIARSALYLPREAQYSYLVNLPENIAAAGLTNSNGEVMNSLGEVVNNAMTLLEQQSEQLSGVLPKEYTMFSDELLAELLRIFNNSALDEVGGDIVGRIYEYFLNKFAKNIAQDDGVFFTPKSLVKMIVNVLEPERGILLDPACGSGGMFVQTGDFVEQTGLRANNSMTFYGQEKVAYNAQLCLMNLAVHGLSGSIKSGDEANTFYYDAHNLEGRCDYVMANPPFNVDKVKAESAQSAGRLPFGLPSVNKNKEFGNANYLWISYFYAYLNEHGRAGFVMASSATDSQSKDVDIRRQLVETGHVDVMVSVGNNFFYTKSLPCSLQFFDKGKQEQLQDKVLFIDARNYYTVVDRTLNEWSQWQLKNLNAIVWLYRGEKEKYSNLLTDYQQATATMLGDIYNLDQCFDIRLGEDKLAKIKAKAAALQPMNFADELQSLHALQSGLNELKTMANETVKEVIADYESMTKSDYKALQAQIKEINGFTLGAVATVKKVLNNSAAEAAAKIDELLTVLEEAAWLYEKFGTGKYADIAGLCKIASVEEIKEKNYSLTPGAYVGVAAEEDDGVDFKERMTEIHKEMLELQAESDRLMQTISKNWEELGL
mgnify:FL=1